MLAAVRDQLAAEQEILDAAIEITHADLGNVQLVDRASGVLRIGAQRGFEAEFLDFFDAVHDGVAACGSAMQSGRRVIVEDVANDPIFEGTKACDILLAAGVLAVQRRWWTAPGRCSGCSRPTTARGAARMSASSIGWTCWHARRRI
jgi:GAF domain-containing protein